MKLPITFCIKLKLFLASKVLYISTLNYFFPHFLSPFLLLCFLQTYYFFIVFLLLSKPHTCHHNAEYTNIFVSSLPKHNSLSRLLRYLFLKFCFLSPAVKWCNIILAFILKKKVSIISITSYSVQSGSVAPAWSFFF